MEKLIAFHGKKEVKDKYLKRVRDHRKADELIRGTGWDSDRKKGCAVGYTFECYDHSRGTIEIGVPVLLMALEDRIFEGLQLKDAMKFPEQFLSAIKPGADLSKVYPFFITEIFTDEKMGLLRFVQKPEFIKQKTAIEAVLKLFENGNMPAAVAAAADVDAAADDARHDFYKFERDVLLKLLKNAK